MGDLKEFSLEVMTMTAEQFDAADKMALFDRWVEWKKENTEENSNGKVTEKNSNGEFHLYLYISRLLS